MRLDLSEILAHLEAPATRQRPLSPAVARASRRIGTSREGRPVEAWVLGDGPLRLSLVAGAHADEPVGTCTLHAVVAWLVEGSESARALLRRARLVICPAVHPDGAERNAVWTSRSPWGPRSFAEGFVRDAPGDDVEFGYPRSPQDHDARPENRALAALLRAEAPFAFHASLHGMAFAEGVWCLIDRGHAERTAELRDDLRGVVARLGLPLHDQDRRGEKGFFGLGPGFSTTPTSSAMAEHFESLGQPETARLFRPSSMELVASLGGDPLCVVSEMPLFLVHRVEDERPGEARSFRACRDALPLALLAARSGDDEPWRRLVQRFGLEAVPLERAVAFQLALIALGSGLVAPCDLLGGPLEPPVGGDPLALSP